MKEALYKTATIIRDTKGIKSFGGMLPGETVAVKYWKHEFDVKTREKQPLFFIAKSHDWEQHFHEGTFACVYKAALENFVL